MPRCLRVRADLGWNDLGYFNGGLTRTVSIDALISQGVLLERFHTFKVCAPSRASTMSGRYPFNVGFYEMPTDDANQCLSNTTLLPELLRAIGYRTHALGSAFSAKACSFRPWRAHVLIVNAAQSGTSDTSLKSVHRHTEDSIASWVTTKHATTTCFTTLAGYALLSRAVARSARWTSR